MSSQFEWYDCYNCTSPYLLKKKVVLTKIIIKQAGIGLLAISLPDYPYLYTWLYKITFTKLTVNHQSVIIIYTKNTYPLGLGCWWVGKLTPAHMSFHVALKWWKIKWMPIKLLMMSFAHFCDLCDTIVCRCVNPAKRP